jgi:hypothetical protein
MKVDTRKIAPNKTATQTTQGHIAIFTTLAPGHYNLLSQHMLITIAY